MKDLYSEAQEIREERGVKGLAEEFPGFVKRRIRLVSRRVGIADSYQESHAKPTEIRWSVIKDRLEGEGSVLDVGCDVGVFTAQSAELGMFSVGVEPQFWKLKRARNRHAEKDGLAFMNLEVTVDNVDRIPQFDVVYLLSVYHQWHSMWGDSEAKDTLEKVVTKAESKVFFENAGMKSKFDDEELPFDDFDEDQVVDWNQALLADVTEETTSVEYLGTRPLATVEGGERYMFLIEK